jgi:hypothetical protein
VRRGSRALAALQIVVWAAAIVILSVVVIRLYEPKANPPAAVGTTSAPAVATSPPAAAPVTLPPQPEPQTLRLLTDLEQGKVTVDGQPAVDLQEGQLVLDKLAPGPHTIAVAGANRDASFSFEIADGQLPAVTGPVRSRNLIAVLVASLGKQARAVTSGGPWKLTVNGQAQGDVGPGGTDLTNFRTGVDGIVVGEGQEQHSMLESYPAGPMLTVFLKSDINAGTLIVSTGQDDVRVFLNGKEYRRRTLRGQLRIQTIGNVVVRVAKAGFQEEPPQSVEVKKGAEARVQFELKPMPKFGSLEIRGATAGAEVWLDQRIAGAVGPDGAFSLGGVQPGEHTVDLRREQYLPKKIQRTFRAGEIVALTGADVVLAAATGTLRFTRNPPSAAITYRRGGEQEPHEVRGDQIELPAGTYTFSATAPGFAGHTVNVQLAGGESRDVEFKLASVRAAPPPPPASTGMADFDDAGTWRKEGDLWMRKGGGISPFRLPSRGVFTFTAEPVKGGKVRWCVQYLDGRTYLLYEMDRKNFWAGVIEKGKRYERIRSPHGLDKQKAYSIQVEVSPDKLVTRVRVGGEWQVLDTFSEAGRDFTQGRFGFLTQGSEEIGVSEFRFAGR